MVATQRKELTTLVKLAKLAHVFNVFGLRQSCFFNLKIMVCKKSRNIDFRNRAYGQSGKCQLMPLIVTAMFENCGYGRKWRVAYPVYATYIQ